MGYKDISPIERLGFDRRMTKEEINSLPINGYMGKIQVIRTDAALAGAIAELSRESLLGFDTETRPNFKKGQNNLPSLIQLAAAETVYIFQLRHLNFSKELRKIFSDKKIIKTGVAIDHDLLQLQRLGPFSEGGFVGLSRIAKCAGIKNHGLRGLAAVLLGFRISKGAQRSNWGSETLTQKQIGYAATDAWVGREIFLRLKEMGVIYPELIFDD
ncbi:MAG: 3'-5' exonuclease domain-containing protein 2 [Desulfobulbaceae bacterium]|nr:3'-5' exonuclease domain-containing protein 2 [Desulfobulbaceae bacterium]